MADEVTAAIEASISGLDEGGGAGAGEPPAPAAPSTPSSPAPAASSPTAAPAAPPADPTAPPVVDPAAPPADAGGKKKSGAFVPLDRHESTLANVREEGTRAVAQVRAEYEGKLTELRTEVQTKGEALTVMENEPERFVAALVQADPRYARYLNPGAVPGAPAGQAAAPAAAAGPVGDMPGPDAPDGSGYTIDGVKRLLDWHADLVEQRIAKRYEPIEVAHRSHAAVSQAAQNVRAKVEGMMARPGFAENQGPIAAAIRANPKLSLEGAYINVVLAGLQPTRDAMRQEILEELRGKPKGVSLTVPGAAPVTSAASDDLISVINAAIAGLE